MREYVSIILPTYNRAHLITRAVNSILEQTYREFELIIVDDGSTDQTEEVIRGLADERIVYIRSSENGGAAKARNIGIRASQYAYVAFQDSDDEWHCDKLEKQMMRLQQSGSETALVYCSYFYHGLYGNEMIFPDESLPLDKKQGRIFPLLLEKNLIGTPVMLIRKSCLLQVGLFNEHLPCMEDHELVLRISREFEIAFIPEILLEVYATNESVTNNPEGFFMSKCLLAGAYRNELLEYGIFNSVVGEILEKAQKLGCLEPVSAYLEDVLRS